MPGRVAPVTRGSQAVGPFPLSIRPSIHPPSTAQQPGREKTEINPIRQTNKTHRQRKRRYKTGGRSLPARHITHTHHRRTAPQPHTHAMPAITQRKTHPSSSMCMCMCTYISVLVGVTHSSMDGSFMSCHVMSCHVMHCRGSAWVWVGAVGRAGRV